MLSRVLTAAALASCLLLLAQQALGGRLSRFQGIMLTLACVAIDLVWLLNGHW
jgi:hypothetical protein